MAVPTKSVFSAIGDGLRDEIGNQVNFVARYEGFPQDAVEENVAKLQGDVQICVLFGYDVDEAIRRDAAGEPYLKGFPVRVLMLSKRSKKAQIIEQAEKLDDLMDAIEDVFSVRNSTKGPGYFNCTNVRYLGRGVVQIRDGNWTGRYIEYEFIKTHKS